MKNYWEVDRFSPFFQYYSYIDSEEHLADLIFIRRKVRVRFMKEYCKPGTPYRFILCRVRKKDMEKFTCSMEDLWNKACLMGYKDYDAFCAKVESVMEQLQEECDSHNGKEINATNCA